MDEEIELLLREYSAPYEVSRSADEPSSWQLEELGVVFVNGTLLQAHRPQRVAWEPLSWEINSGDSAAVRLAVERAVSYLRRVAAGRYQRA